MAVVKSSLIVSLMDRLTGPSKGITASLNRLQAASRENTLRLAGLRGQMFDAAGAAFALYRGLSAPIQSAMQFESAMADVRKVVDFPTPDAFRRMSDDVRKLSLEIPMAADGLAAIVAAAGQSGLSNDELLPFAQMAAKVGVAWDVTAGQAGEALAKLKTSLGLNVAETGLLADAINHLGNNTAASAPAILDVTRRVAPMAGQFGLSAEQAAAFGAAMVGAGFEAEVASTSFLNMGRNLTLGASASGRQKKAMQQLGLSTQTVARNMQKDATGTIQDIFSRLRAAPDHMRAALMSDIFGSESRALGPLITNSELLAQALGLIGDKTRYAGSANEEYAVRSQTFENSMILFRNRINDLNISIGNALLPSLNSIVGAIGPIVTSMSDLAQRFPGVTSAIVAVSSAVIGFRVASIGAQYAGLFVKGAFIDAGIAALSAARSIGGIMFAPVVAGFNSLRSAVVGYTASAAILGNGGAMAIAGKAMLGLLNPLRLVKVAVNGLKVALIGSGIGALLVGIGLAGVFIYNQWEGITVAFEAFKRAFMKAIEPVLPAIQPLIDGFSWLWDAVAALVGPVDEMNGGWAALGITIGKFLGGAIVGLVELPAKIIGFAGQMLNAGERIAQSMWDGVKSIIGKMVDWFSELPGRIVKAIGNIDIGGLIKWPSFLGGGSSSDPTPVGIDGARASGGPIKAGGSYLVGEKGPEVVTFGQSGYVHDALNSMKMLRNAALASAVMAAPASAAPMTIPHLQKVNEAGAPGAEASRSVQVHVASGAIQISVTAQPGQSPERIAQAVSAELAGQLRAASNGAFSDGGY